jgi:hypothetical protein
MRQSDDDRLSDRVRWGAGWGLYLGLGQCGLQLVAFAAGKRPTAALWALLPVYLVGGVLTGGIVGVLRPWADSDLRAAVVGFVAMVPVTFALFLLIASPVDFRAFSPWMELITAALLGGLGGPFLRSQVLFVEPGYRVRTNWKFVSALVGAAAVLVLLTKLAHWW